MKSAIVVALLATCALSASGGSYHPDFHLDLGSPVLGADTRPWFSFDNIQFFDKRSRSTGKVTLYVPRGYGGPRFYPVGTKVGSFLGGIEDRSSYMPADGFVTTADPGLYRSNACSPGLHHAVWIISFEHLATDQVFRVPIYVDRITTRPEADYASARLVFCLPSPSLPPPKGWEQPIAFQDAILYFNVRGHNDVFTNPDRQGTYPWNVVFVPYSLGTPNLDARLATQTTLYATLPVRLALTAKRQRRNKQRFATVTACVWRLGRPVRGGPTELKFYYGGTTVEKSTRVANLHPNSSGCATTRIRVRSAPFVWVAAYVAGGSRQSSCAPKLAPRCLEPRSTVQVLQRSIRVRR